MLCCSLRLTASAAASSTSSQRLRMVTPSLIPITATRAGHKTVVKSAGLAGTHSYLKEEQVRSMIIR